MLLHSVFLILMWMGLFFFLQALDQSFTEEVIASSWRDSGMFPFNAKVILENTKQHIAVVHEEEAKDVVSTATNAVVKVIEV